jgi:urate oxidase
MSFDLVANNYGKSGIRLLRLDRSGQRHEIKDISVDIQFEGEFGAVHTQGDNSAVLPTDTMKNTVYALAARQPLGEIENFGMRLVSHFLTSNPQVSRVTVRIGEHLWSHIPANGTPHPTAFVSSGRELRTARIIGTREETLISGGLEQLLVLRTADSAFTGFIKDAYTTLAETRDRIFATMIKAEWIYTVSDASFGSCWEAIRNALVETFATHKSESVQHTLYKMAESGLECCDQIREIRLSLPNKHHLAFDLTRFGIEDRAEVFVPTDEPYGLIEATLRRS